MRTDETSVKDITYFLEERGTNANRNERNVCETGRKGGGATRCDGGTKTQDKQRYVSAVRESVEITGARGGEVEGNTVR